MSDPFARIVNRKQRDALVRAIEAREDIPEYAWAPIPSDVSDEQWDEFRAIVRPAAERYMRDLLREEREASNGGSKDREDEGTEAPDGLPELSEIWAEVMVDVRDFKTAVAAAIARRPHLSDEDADALRAALLAMDGDDDYRSK